MSTRSRRMTKAVSTVAGGSLLAGAALLGGVPVAPADTGLMTAVQHDIMLVDMPGAGGGIILLPPTDPAIWPDFDQSMRVLLDAYLGIGGATLPELLDPDGTVTLESLLGGSGLTLVDPGGSTMTDLFNALGLDNIPLGDVLSAMGINSADDMATILGPGGALSGVGGLTLNEILTSLGGLDDQSTILNMVEALGMASTTVGALLGDLGFTSTATMGDLFTQLGIPGLAGFLGLMGATPTTPVATFLASLGMDPSTLTLGDLLDPNYSGTDVWGGLLGTIGGMDLGTLLNFDATTNIGDVLLPMEFDLNGTMTPLGDWTFAEVLTNVQMDPGDSLADILGSLPLGTGGASDLGTTTLADFLGVMAGDAPTNGVVDDTTTITEFLTGAGMGTLTIDQWLGLDAVDISNWFTP